MNCVFDLDDTLADCHHRVLKYIVCPERGRPYRQDPVDWDSFFKECVHDAPIEWSWRVFSGLVHIGADVRIWTGRCASTREATKDWLACHAPSSWLIDLGRRPELLVMRPEGNRIDDHVLKPSWMAKENFVPDLVFEDRTRVVEAWRSLGVPCFQVAPGDF